MAEKGRLRQGGGHPEATAGQAAASSTRSIAQSRRRSADWESQSYLNGIGGPNSGVLSGAAAPRSEVSSFASGGRTKRVRYPAKSTGCQWAGYGIEVDATLGENSSQLVRMAIRSNQAH